MGAPEPRSTSAEPRLHRCAELTELTTIFEPDCNAAVLPRTLPEALTRYLDDPRVHALLGNGMRTRVRCNQTLPAETLPATPGREALLDDIRGLTEIMGDLLDCDHVGLRLEVLRKAMCPRFHVDRVGIRLLCCYRGNGTEYLQGSHADRSKLGHAAVSDDEDSGLILDAAGIHRAPRYAITLIKGAAWPGNAEHGAIHRSPQVLPDDAPRIVLALDAIWT